MVIFDHAAKTVLVVANAAVDRDRGRTSAPRTPTRAAGSISLVERLQRGVADIQLTDIDPIRPSLDLDASQ